ncbi:MAG: primosomal protein N' (replication factor Y), partial [Limisphaerales bacterium]
MLFAKVILPLALPDTYTYAVPEDMQDWIKPGHCVEVQFGKSKLYTAVIESVSDEVPQGYTPKPILATLSTQPVVQAIHIRFWKWMSEYYMCTLGDIMIAALPALYRLNSETRIVLNGSFDGDFTALDDRAYLVAEALTMQKELSLGDVQLILQRKAVQPIIRTLIDNKVAVIYEELKPTYKPKTRSYVTLNPELEDEDKMRTVFDQLEKKAPKQLTVLMTWMEMSRDTKLVYKAQLIQKSGAGPSSFKALVTKGIFELKEATVSRLEDGGAEGELFELNEAQ